ncbi:hypothetical protein BIU88_00455 [Chlorobaculum limnaeum]|uniref:Serine acetyltransferase n=1 Tax=Chlorobaculum limnaeum TaxID=274537 RepID=A0A1D8D633_CHLLM|nr:serine acetyltransferase [Chlorobaculum limnaeum]AOS84937.1 hypothetical protein BIU88_00455 [Chlorobaculum limnaeum]
MEKCKIFQDWKYNKHDVKIRIVLVAFRIAQCLNKKNKFIRAFALPYLFLYKIFVFWFFHIELHWNLNIGEGLRIIHGYSLVIHPNARIGNHVTLRHCVTIGNNGKSGEAPIIMDNVNVGANAVIIGPVTIGENAVIGAGAVVTKNVEKNSVVVGNPAKNLRYIK